MINVHDTTTGNLIVKAPVQGDNDGTVLGFSDGTASALLSGGLMKLGGVTVSSGTATTLNLFVPSIIAVAVPGNGWSDDASAGNKVYTFAAGNYTYNIAGFGAGDVLTFPAGNGAGVNNMSFTDGVVELTWSSGGNTLTIQLTGISAAKDMLLNSSSDFNTVFGAGTFN
jgi:hypothetical protein